MNKLTGHKVQINRRDFIKALGVGATSLSLPKIIYGDAGTKKDNAAEPRIEKIELYHLNILKSHHFSYGIWKNRQYVFVKISIGQLGGWSETMAATDNLEFDVSAWGEFLSNLKGMTISDALAYVKSKQETWEARNVEMTEIALVDLMGRIQNKPAVELLGLAGREPIPGLFCILEDDLEKAKTQAKISIQSNLKTHIKLKIFGKPALDIQLTKGVREVMGPDAFIVADANAGYGKKESKSNIDEISQNLINLNINGLNACEDPAQISNEDWVSLQKKVGYLTLIPDYPMRPARKAINTLLPGMGRIYNIHPECMGSLYDAIALAGLIKKWDAGLMIGDNGFVGPACTAWQQIGIGLGAKWVEALEKPHELESFPKCVKSQATYAQSDGRLAIKPDQPGFGLVLDEKALKENSNSYCMI